MKPRLLVKEDFHKGFFNLLSQLTPVHFPTYQQFCKQFCEMKELNPLSRIFVIEKNGCIVATGKLFVELKFHNNFAFMGHIEDVVVDSGCRGKGYGKLIIETLLSQKSQESQKKKCYKIVLNCSLDNIPFYKKCGMKQKGTEMVKYQK